MNTSIISDSAFDKICKELLQRLQKEEVPKEFNKFISKDNLKAGSGFDIPFRFIPQRIKDCAYILSTGKDFSGDSINLEEWLK